MQQLHVETSASSASGKGKCAKTEIEAESRLGPDVESSRDGEGQMTCAVLNQGGDGGEVCAG